MVLPLKNSLRLVVRVQLSKSPFILGGRNRKIRTVFLRLSRLSQDQNSLFSISLRRHIRNDFDFQNRFNGIGSLDPILFFSRLMFFGFLLGVSACMIWGIVYVIPLILADYSPAFIALARYLVFAIVSAVYLWVHRRNLTLTARDWRQATLLSLIGNLTFYWVLSEAVIRIGAAMAGIFTACIPLVTSIWVLIRSKRPQTIDFRLWLALSVITAGLIFLNIERVEIILGNTAASFQTFSEADNATLINYAVGIVFALLSVVIWTWFPLKNAEWLKKHAGASIPMWTAAQGVTLFPITFLTLGIDTIANNAFLWPDLHCLFWLLVLGLGCSWLGNLLWNAASRRLPQVIVGQMLVFETISAILYASILDGTRPSPSMLVGSSVVLTGVLFSLNILRRQESDKNAS